MPQAGTLAGRSRSGPHVVVKELDRQGVHLFTIRLEGALVTRISRIVRPRGLHEEVAFAFRAIQLVDGRSWASASHQFSGRGGLSPWERRLKGRRRRAA